MLELLRIKNLALIHDMELEFHSGLNVLTGESGAGKTFIMKALDFLLGEKMSTTMIRPGHDKAVVEGIFVQDGNEYILKRELAYVSGRSRFYLNDSLSSLDAIQCLRERLLIHTSQHGQQKLLKPGQHIRIVDAFLDDFLLLKEKDEVLNSLQKLLERKDEVHKKLVELEEKKDLLEYQKSRIDQVRPKPGEEEELMLRREEIKTRSELNEEIKKAVDLLHAPETRVLDSAHELFRTIDHLSRLNQNFLSQASEMENLLLFLQELDRTLKSSLQEDDGRELENVEARLWELAQLKRRLNRSLDQIMHLDREIGAHLSFLDEGRLEIVQLERKEEEVAQKLAHVVQKLNRMRRECAEKLKADLEKELKFLGFSEHVLVDFEFVPEEIYPDIAEDKPRLLWIPNPGQPPQPLDKIASGGELSRFMLALVCLHSEKNLPTLLFDEVDSGIGGNTLNQVGQRIAALAENRQVLLITHWPQLACLAHRHFMVQKQIIDQETYTLCARLDRLESKAELARMAAGENSLEMAANLDE